MSKQDTLRQISLNVAFDPEVPYHENIDEDSYTLELREFRQNLLGSSTDWPEQLDMVASPLPLVIPDHLAIYLKDLGDILCRAITSIVERWWSDEGARFYERMPILPHQEAVLRFAILSHPLIPKTSPLSSWLDGPGRDVVKPFSSVQGAWRPDFLLDEQLFNADLPSAHPSNFSVQICEINARFAFNGIGTTAFAHEAYQQKDLQNLGLKSPIDHEKIFAAYERVFDVNKPLHLLKGAEAGIDIHLFAAFLRNRRGLRVRFITPADLRLIPNKNAKSGHTICCAINPTNLNAGSEEFQSWTLVSRDGEILEQIHQVGIELHQWELRDLGEDMLKALAPLCFNDLRAIYLVHDKRMLGIVLQEIDSLVQQHQVLNAEDGEVLRRSIVPTAIPGSKELQDLINLGESRLLDSANYLLKPVGSGKGKGIIFGSDITAEEWNNSLQRLSNCHVAEGRSYVVQRVIKQPQFNVVTPGKDQRPRVSKQYLVGTIIAVNGESLGTGSWRSSSKRICAVSKGGTWMCSLMLDHRTNAPAPAPVTALNAPRIAVTNLSQSTDAVHVQLVHETLQKNGILLLTLDFPDPESQYLFELTQSLSKKHAHNPPLVHSAEHGHFWDVKPSPASTGKSFHARSHTSDDFPWHTDCSYAANPPRFFALHVLQADRCGGGTLSILQLSKLLEMLSSETIKALCADEYEVSVPPEFANGVVSITGPILSSSALDFSANPNWINNEPRIRFRADIVKPLTERAASALEELNTVLAVARDRSSGMSVHLDPSMIPNGTVILLDNGRWLHARNQVMDIERHLRRIRWDARIF